MDDILQSFVQWPALWMAARLGDLVLIQTWLPLLCKSSCFNANEWHLIEKIREVFIKARSPPGPLAFIYQVTEQTTIKWQVFSSASCSAMVSSYVTCQEKLGDNPLTQKWRSDGQAQSSARVYQNVFRVNCSLTLKKLFLMLKLFNVVAMQAEAVVYMMLVHDAYKEHKGYRMVFASICKQCVYFCEHEQWLIFSCEQRALRKFSASWNLSLLKRCFAPRNLADTFKTGQQAQS